MQLEWIRPSACGPGPWTEVPSAAAALEQAVSSRAELAVVDLSVTHPLDPEACTESLRHIDFAHGGLESAGRDLIHALGYLGFNWLLADPSPVEGATSWKALPTRYVLRPESARRIGGVDPAYVSAQARVLDLAFRLLRNGARVIHTPRLACPEPHASVPAWEQFLFCMRNYGVSHAAYAASLSAATGNVWAPVEFQRALAQHRATAEVQQENTSTFALTAVERPRNRVSKVSAIIPTLQRYEFLPDAIRSLLAQRPAPDEILVVDQTPVAERRADIYRPLPNSVRPIFIEERGQCIARNTALAVAQHDWCLMFDDDSICREGMIQAHIDLVERTGCDASTGASLAPWKTSEALPHSLRRPHVAPVFDTGNALVKKASMLGVGGFDRAFDRGSGADNDLGSRMYLAGAEILFNPNAVRTHLKAESGGLRAHGAWWRGKTGAFQAFPPPTELYTLDRLFARDQRVAQVLLKYLRAGHRHSRRELIWLWLAAPYRLTKAINAARALSPNLGFQPHEDQAKSPEC